MIDLKQLADRKYKIRLDESYEADQGGKEWYYQIPCKHGHIFVQGKSELGVFTNKPNINKFLKEISGLRKLQIGDKEFSYGFPPELMDQVAEVMRARRRPRLSDEQRQAMSDRIVADPRFQTSKKQATD